MARIGRSARAFACASFAVLVPSLDAEAAGRAASAKPRPAAQAVPAGTGTAVAGQVVVRYREGVDLGRRGQVRGGRGVRLARRTKVPRAEVVEIRDGASVAQKARELETDPAVEFAEPNVLYTLDAIPNDTRFGELWGLHNTGQTVNGTAGTADADIDAPEAWDVTRGSRSVVVAVVDTGIALDHPELAGPAPATPLNLWRNPGETGTAPGGADRRTNGVDDDGNGYVDDWRGWDVIGAAIDDPDDSDNDPTDPVRDQISHGTHVAGTIGALGANALGVAGVAHEVSVMPLRVGDENRAASNVDIVEAFIYAADNGARVVNASLGSPSPTSLMRSVIDTHPDVLFMTSAGNSGLDLDQPGNNAFPCEYTSPNVICTAASTQTDSLAGFSNFSEVSVDLAAPGNNVLSTRQLPIVEVLDEDFETDPFAGRWTKGAAAGTNQWGRTTQFGTPIAGNFSVEDTPDGGYANNTDTFITRQAFSLSGRRNCELSAPFSLNSEPDADGLYAHANTTTSFPAGSASSLISGFGTGTLRIDLTALDNQPTVNLRLGFFSNGAWSADLGYTGVVIDDVRVTCQPTGYSANLAGELAYLNGTSMAAPHVSGVAALLLARAPGATPATLRSRILGTGDTKAAFSAASGRTVTGRRLNAFGAVNASAAWVDAATVKFTAGPGVANDVTVSAPAAGVLRISDPARTILPGRGCTAVTATSVDCRPGPGTPRLDIAAGSGNDTVRVDAAVAGTLKGESGADVLRGGTLKDTIDGGEGLDMVSYGTRSGRVAVTLDQVVNDGADPNGDRVSSASEENDVLLAIENATGGSGGDWLRAVNANATPNQLVGGPGNDQIRVREGTATVDRVVCGTGADEFDKDASDTAAVDCETAVTLP